MTTLAEAMRALEHDFARLAPLAPHLCADAIDATPEAAVAAERVNRLLDRIGVAGLDPHLPAMIHVRAARRRFERVTLGGCRCGEVTGEALCPWCDLGLTKGPDDIARDGQRRAERLAAIEKLWADLQPKPKAEPPGATRSPNRFERRRAASRRWRG